MKKSLFTIILASLLTLTACSPAADTKESSDVAPTEATTEITTEAVTEATTEAPTEKSTENVIEDSSATEKKFTCYVDGQRVGGRLYHPEGEGPFPTIVFVPGMGMNYYLYAELFENLNSEGIAVAAFDCRGNAPTSSVSDGKFIEMTVSSCKTDIKTVTDFISAYQMVDSENLFLMGHSLGGFNGESRELFSEEPETYILDGVEIGETFAKELMAIDLTESIKSYDGNTIILTGTGEAIYSLAPEIMDAAAEALPNGELIVVEGADHGFNQHLKELIQYTVDFVKENTD